MKKIISFLLVPALAGCLTTETIPQVEWPVLAVLPANVQREAPKFGVTRLSQIAVRAPYDVRSIAVSRADGSIGFDAYNQYPALPSQLLKGPALDLLAASGCFKKIVHQSSSAEVKTTLELAVRDFRLVARPEDSLSFRVALSLFALDKNRAIVAHGRADESVRVEGGDFGAAVSKAFSQSILKAAAAL